AYGYSGLSVGPPQLYVSWVTFRCFPIRPRSATLRWGLLFCGERREVRGGPSQAAGEEQPCDCDKPGAAGEGQPQRRKAPGAVIDDGDEPDPDRADAEREQ